jgi:eukaryotic-like serine/threonine-protein kinase
LSSQRWRQIEELYHSACEHGAAVLDGVEPELRQQVEMLLSHNSESGSKLLDQRAADLISGLSDGPITPGTRLGPYRIEAELGKGGMGRVFRARDTRLNRSVAIKICNEEFIDRFEQEARAIAVISHPNVCTLFDVGPNYLVMELVEGETLAARLKRGKLSISDTLRYGAQIAEALAVAHAQGIIHRDLKPGNIMLAKSGAKVLDFGLAKSTVDPSVTATGNVMGTPAYLAPERLEGKEADARSDIYALGLILAEMLTGKRSATPEDLPPALDRVIQRCLQIDPDERWQSARDLKWELESIALAPAPRSSFPRYALIAGAITLALALSALFALLHFREQSPSPPLARLNVLLPENSIVRSIAVSPDGRFIAMVLLKQGKQQIWIRALDSTGMMPLEGTDDAADPFWSPDSRFLGFFADSKLKKIERTGGPVQTLCDALGTVGGTWNSEGDILIGALGQILRVSDTGGAVSRIPGQADGREIFPMFLPDGRHYLATREGSQGASDAGLWLNSMDGSEARRILPDTTRAQVVAAPPGSSTGAILFTRAGTLMALPFDERRLEAAGEPSPVAQQIAVGTNSEWLAASSYSGVVAYVSGQLSRWQYVWRDRQGKNLGAIGNSGGVVMISPDGKRLVGDPRGQITLQDLEHGTVTRLTVGSSGGQNPALSADGRYVAYNGAGGIYRQATAGGTPPELLLPSQTLAVPKSWSPDGRYLIYAQVDPGKGSDLFALPIGQPGAKQIALWQTPAASGQGEFSPDGRWVAITANDSGQNEIYVIPFPPNPNGEKWLVSVGGGVMPRWHRDGKELFYISQDWKMMAVDVSTQPTFRSGTPHALFDTEMVDTGIRNGPMSWDVAPDGKRFLIITDNSTSTSSLNVILNWRPE